MALSLLNSSFTMAMSRVSAVIPEGSWQMKLCTVNIPVLAIAMLQLQLLPRRYPIEEGRKWRCKITPKHRLKVSNQRSPESVAHTAIFASGISRSDRYAIGLPTEVAVATASSSSDIHGRVYKQQMYQQIRRKEGKWIRPPKILHWQGVPVFHHAVIQYISESYAGRKTQLNCNGMSANITFPSTYKTISASSASSFYFFLSVSFEFVHSFLFSSVDSSTQSSESGIASGSSSRGVVRPQANRNLYYLYTDGAAKSNPGEAGCGGLVYSSSQSVCLQYYCYLGPHATNNEAEFEGLIRGLAAILQQQQNLQVEHLVVRVDSKLVEGLVKGEMKVKKQHLAMYLEKVRHLLKSFPKWEIEQIDRSENREADKLANRAVDEKNSHLLITVTDILPQNNQSQTPQNR